MKKSTVRTVEFTFEKSEEVVIRLRHPIYRAWCYDCQNEVGISSPEVAAKATGVSTRRIYAGIETGKTHFTESADGLLVVCHRSLLEPDPVRS